MFGCFKLIYRLIKGMIALCMEALYTHSYGNMLNAGYFKSDIEWICEIIDENESNEGSNIIQMNSNNVFMDGEYDSYYKFSLSLCGKYWHKMNLTFNHDSNEVNGYGIDKGGKFKINGLFSSINDVSRIALTKQYIGYQAHMRLEYRNNQFIGAWHIKPKVEYFKIENKRFKEERLLTWGECGFKLARPKPTIITPETSNNDCHDMDVTAAFLSNDNV